MYVVRRTFSVATAVVAAVAVIAAVLTAWAGPPPSAGPGKGPTATPDQEAAALDAFADLPLSFVENQGQTDGQVSYHAQGSDYAFYLTPRQIMLSFTEDPRVPAHGTPRARGVNLALRFLEANDDVRMDALAPSDTQLNYVRGSERTGWHTGLSAYGQVVYRDLWPGIDMVLQGDGGELKYEFHVQPGAALDDVRLAYAGAQGLSLDDSGDLLIKTPLGRLQDSAPVSYQQIDGRRLPVDSRYVVAKGNEYGFAVGSYDRDHELIIDPSLDYSTFVGGASADSAGDLVVDADGNAILVGTTQSTDFPATPGAFDQTFNGGGVDVFVAKLNADGSGLVYATYLGGVPTPTRRGNTDLIEVARAVAVDSAGNAYLTGQTSSGNFPVTAGAFQTTQQVGENTATEGFVTKLGPAGALVYSTFLGGLGSDDGRSIAVDAGGNAYIGGSTFSEDFPTTAGAFDTTNAGNEDVFVTKLNASGSGLVYSTLVGGADTELTEGIALDTAGNAFVSGSTRSVEYPTTAGSFQPTHSGGTFAELFEGFVTKVDTTGSGLAYSTFLGGTDIDRLGDLVVDSAGSAYVAGGTLSADFPTTPGAFDPVFDGTSEGTVTKLNPAGSDLVYSTFFEGAGDVALDSAENLWLAGGAEAGAPTTPDAFQPQNNGGRDVYITQLNDTGSALNHATFFGGPGNEGAGAIALDPADNIYVAGTTMSAAFPTTPGAFDRVWNGDASIFWGDAFVAKFAGDATPPPADGAPPTVSITSPAEGSTVAGTVQVSADASDDVGVSEVRFFVDDTLIGSDTTAPYQATWDTTTVVNDTHTLTASALDAAGRTGSAAPVTVTVANSAPPITSTFSAEIDDEQTLTHVVPSGEGPVDWSLDWDEDRVDLDVEVRGPGGNVVDSDTGNTLPKSGSFQATVAGDYTFRIINNTDRDTTYTLTVTRPDPTAAPPPSSDTVRPEVRITNPASQSTVSGTVSVTATASDDVGVERVEFIVNDSVTIATDAEAPYEASWDTTAFPDGLGSVTARAFDTSGNAGAHRIPVTIDNAPQPPADTTAPTVSITSPAAGSTVSGTTTVAATAADDVGVTAVSFFADGTPIGTDTTAPYEASWDTTTVANGSHTLTASASDVADNTGQAVAVAVTVDNAVDPPADTTAPTVSITSPAAGSTVSGTTTVAATAADDVGVTAVSFFADGTPIGTDTTAPYEASWDTTTVANGSHTLTASASDAAGNTGQSTAINVTVDNAVAPAEPLTTTFTGELDDQQTVNHVVSSAAGPVQWTLDWDEDRVDLDVQVRDPGGNVVDSDTGNARPKSGSFQADVAGDYQFRVISNTERDTEYTLSVTHPDPSSTAPPADVSSPDVSLTSPTGGATVSGTVSVEASASDESGVTEVSFFADGVPIGTDTTAPYSVSWDTTGLADGSHELTARASDGAGNTGAAEAVTVTVDNTVEPPADTTAPTVAVTSPAAGSTVSGTVALAASASDEVGVTEVRFFADGTLLGTDTTAPYDASWDTTVVADGSHQLTARAFDAAGNAGDAVAVTVTVDNTVDPPADTAAPTVTISSPAAGSTVSGTTSVTATASDDVGVAEVRFFAGGDPIGTDTTAPYEASWDTTALANGPQELTATAVDATGNVGSAQAVSVTVDNATEPPQPERTTSSFSGEIDDEQTLTHTVASSAGTVEWTLDWDEDRVDLDVQVLGPGGNVVDSDTGNALPKSGSFEAAVAGNYRFRIINNTDRDADYTLDVTHPAP